VDSEEASWRPASGRNSIWDLVLHRAYGRYLIHRRLHRRRAQRVKGFPRPLRSSWWPEPATGPLQAAWEEDRALLQTYQRKLLGTLHRAADDLAEGRVWSGDPKALEVQVLGLVAHDAYHAGQMRLMRKLYACEGEN